MQDKIFNKWIIFLMLLFVSIVLIIFLFEYNNYIVCYGEVVDGHLKILVEEKNLKHLTNDLIIDEKQSQCNFLKMNLTPIIDNNYDKYFEIFYSCKLNINQKGILIIKVNLGKTTIYQTVKKNVERIEKWN